MKLKVPLTLLGVVLFFTGFLGFFVSIGTGSVSRIGKFYDPVPVRPISGIAIDSVGNLHVGARGRNSIQVFNNTGEFLYRFSFPAGGGLFEFYIDNYDIVHVATARGSHALSFDNGYLIHQRSTVVGEVADFGNRRQNVYYDYLNNRYEIRPTAVRMYDHQGNFLRRISPSTTVWPFSPPLMFLIALLGIVFVITVNGKFFLVILQTIFNNKATPSQK